MPQEKLRSTVGCDLPEAPDSSLEKSLKASGCSVWTFPQCGKAVITEFPNRSFISCIIAPGIVYPALQRYFDVRFASFLMMFTRALNIHSNNTSYNLSLLANCYDEIFAILCLF